MRREQQIPLFLWVATALVAHALGGGGATKVAQQLEETMDIGSFASAVRAKAKFAGPTEVTFEEAKPEEAEDTPEPDDTAVPKDESDAEEPTDVDPDVEDDDDKSEENVEVEEEKPEEKKEPEKAEEKPAEPKPEEQPVLEEKPPELSLAEKPKPKPQPLDNRRVAVQQHVEDENQEDNPNARFAGEHANRVTEETQAQITSTDQNAKQTSAGNNFQGTQPDPGNSEESKVAQSDENQTEDDRPGAGERSRAAAAARASSAPMQKAPALPTVVPQSAQEAQTAREARAATEAREGMVETHHHGGGAWGIARAREAEAEQKAQKARKAREAREAIRQAFQKKKKNQPLFGFGSTTTTENGVRLSLSQDMAEEVIGHDQLDNLQEEVGKRRLSQHRGSWTNVGLEKWHGAIENYVASVKPGNQTALNTARVPFAAYLNQIHQRLHQVFAHGFLGHLEQLPPKHPLNNPDMSTHVEIALSREDGRIVKMGITKSSGVTAFDVGALESVSKAAPYGPPPGSIVSSDGNVYLHWEFHRNRNYACSTYFARPYIIDAGQSPAPPRVEPPPKPDERENRKPDERSGALEPNRKPDGHNESKEESRADNSG